MAYEIVAGRSPTQREKFGLAGTILLGKNYVKFDSTVNLANQIYLDVANPHVILVSGKRGSGKSYTLSVIAEGLVDLPSDVSENISALIFDTMGIFWTMKYPNYRDDALLREWGLAPKSYRPIIYVPFGLFADYQAKGVPVDVPFAIKPSEVSADSWCEMFELDLISGEGTLIERALESAKEKFGDNFEINDLIDEVKKDPRASQKEKNVVEGRFIAAKKWGLFSKAGTKITELFKGGTTTILDLSAYTQIEGGERIKALVIGLVCSKILEQRMAARKAEEISLISEGGFLFGAEAAVTEAKAPLVWIFIDEAHEFLPRESEKQTLASRPLIQLLREGRQPGISLVLATQQPGKIHTDVMTQADIVISHRLTAKIDIEALNLIAATYLPYTIQKYLDELPPEKGTAVLIDDKLEKIYPMRVRPKMSWHGGEDPTALRESLRAFGLFI
jgi:ABC-type dipeptide/oligopeptide/nickel transport system ATPase component